jgi:diguanylate cyclase (GGDEF)-like protein
MLSHMTESSDFPFDRTQFAEFLFDHLDEALLIVDPSRRVIRTNAPFRKLFSVTDQQEQYPLFGKIAGCPHVHEAELECTNTEFCSVCPINQSIRRALSEKKEITSEFIPWNCTSDGTVTTRYLYFVTRPLLFLETPLVIVSVYDVTEMELQRQKIRDMANHDFVTGLPNRRYFYEVVQPFYLTAQRGFFVIAICMIDIDFFKKVNDRFGHCAGDFILGELGRLMQSQLRKSDFIARYGGEEFCLLLECTAPEDSFSVVEKLRKAVASHDFIFEQTVLHITISCGISTTLADSADSMIRHADELLYRAKQNGRNRTETDFISVNR